MSIGNASQIAYVGTSLGPAPLNPESSRGAPQGPIVVGRPTFVMPPGSLPATAQGELISRAVSSSSGGGDGRRARASSCCSEDPLIGARRSLSNIYVLPPPIQRDPRIPFGDAFISGPLFESVCLCLEPREWHLIAVSSRVSFNSLAMCRLLNGVNGASGGDLLELPEVSTQEVLTKRELMVLLGLAFVVWIIIFFGGRKEWEHGIARECSDMCEECGLGDLSFIIQGCRVCKQGFYNGGMKCYARLEDLPSVRTGAALGGAFYYYAIIIVQVLGASSEIFLLRRLRKRRQVVGKELCVALTALSVEILRMVLVDLFLLRTYFFNHSYKIFPVDVNPSERSYVIAWSHLNATDINPDECSVFGADSPLLDYDESFGWGTGGHPRFRTTGWAIGGEFAMYYFFAAVVNEVADNLFIIPATTLKYGFKCKVMSIILELFQLGALFPAAAFTHGECLIYHNPLNADLNVIRYTIVTWGYFLWGSVFVIGIFTLVVGALHVVVFQPGCGACRENILPALCQRCHCFRGAGQGRTARMLFKCRDKVRAVMATCLKCVERMGASTLEIYVFLASIPLLITGTCLGVLVCLGQMSKSGVEAVLTAIVLLSDVLLKLGLFGAVEVTDEILRREGEQQRAERTKRLEEAQRQMDAGGGALAFPLWWERKSQAPRGPSHGWRKQLWKLLHA